MKLLSDLSFFPLDGDTVVFSERAQRLLSLDPLATDLVHALQQGRSPQDLVHDLSEATGTTPETAAAWLAGTMDMLASHGFLDDGRGPSSTADATAADEPAAPVAPGEKEETGQTGATGAFASVGMRCFRLLRTTFGVRYSHHAQSRMVDSVIGHLGDPGPVDPDVVFDVIGTPFDGNQMRSDVVCNGVRIGHAKRLSFLGPIVKAALWERAVNGFDFLFFLHAGVVGTGDGCILLPAASGSGKSSLTTALTDAGFRYYSDEVALLERGTFLVPPVPLSICIKDSGWELMARYVPDLAGLPVHRRQDGKIVRYSPPPASAMGSSAAPVRHIIFPQYRAGARTEIGRVPRAAALGLLMGECLALRQRLDTETVASLVEWMSSFACHRLTFASLDEAVALVRGVTESASADLEESGTEARQSR